MEKAEQRQENGSITDHGFDGLLLHFLFIDPCSFFILYSSLGIYNLNIHYLRLYCGYYLVTFNYTLNYFRFY